MGLSVFALLLVMLVAMMSLLQPCTSSMSTNSTAAWWCNGRVDECLNNAKGLGTDDDVLDPMVDFSEMSRRLLVGKSHHIVLDSGTGNKALCNKPNQRYRCYASNTSGGKGENCQNIYHRNCR